LLCKELPKIKVERILVNNGEVVLSEPVPQKIHEPLVFFDS
jgi:hypothetical protein